MVMIHDRANGIVADTSAPHDHTKTKSNYCVACVARGMERRVLNHAKPTAMDEARQEKHDDDRREWYE